MQYGHAPRFKERCIHCWLALLCLLFLLLLLRPSSSSRRLTQTDTGALHT
jgi:hypothetical protein